MKEIENKIKEFYNLKALSSKQLEIIKRQSQNRKKTLISISNLVKYAAAIVFITSMIFGVIFLREQNHNSIINDFAEEIAFNHKKRLPSEIKTTSITELNHKMNKLDFELILPNTITTNFKLKGGRYCSVDGRIAAQLQLGNAQKEMITCYVFRKKEKFNFNEVIYNHNVKVSIWNNEVLIFALASNANKKGNVQE